MRFWLRKNTIRGVTMSKYLYGASMQGLQDFIFQTNKLKEIIGASELIKSFDEFNLQKEFNLSQEPTIILQAAGNLRAIFSNEEDAKKVIKYLPKALMQKIYGITISQSVVKLDDYSSAIATLEKNLKIQRNKNPLPLDFHFSFFETNPKTSLPAIKQEKQNGINTLYDESTWQKEVAFRNAKSKDSTLSDDPSLKNNKNKIAIIHIDGNGLGKIVRKLQENEIKDFSKKLQQATQNAYNEAYSNLKDEKSVRKVILGGDDLTLICDANLALKFTQNFLESFEKNTKNIYKENSLSACAGIAYCNEKFPFFYAVKLAENLCSYAKKDSKNIDESTPPSSLMFHNIQSSNVESFQKFIGDELIINGVSCVFGPYYLNPIANKPTIQNFLALKEDFKKENSPKGRLRDWLNSLKFDRNFANLELKRIHKIFSKKWQSDNFTKLHKDLSLQNLIIKKDDEEKTPLYDILQILSVED